MFEISQRNVSGVSALGFSARVIRVIFPLILGSFYFVRLKVLACKVRVQAACLPACSGCRLALPALIHFLYSVLTVEINIYIQLQSRNINCTLQPSSKEN